MGRLDLTLDPARNTLWFGATAVPGRHRWEAAWLALLADGTHGHAAQALELAQLQAALVPLGQRVALNRKQLARLQQSLAEMFAAQGHALAQRWHQAPRQRTVGPWWWVPQPGDRVRLHGQAEARTRAGPAWPRLAREASLPAMLTMCATVLSYQPRWEGGPYGSVLPVLADPLAWRLASPEMQAMRWLQTTSSHLHTRRLKDAHASLHRAQRILDRDPVAALHLGAWAVTLRLGLLRIDPDDRRRRQGAELLAASLALPPGAAPPEVDRLAHLFRYAFGAVQQMQATRRALGRHAPADARPHLQQALQLFNAALFCAFTARHFDHMKNLLAHLGSFAQGLYEAGLVDDVSQPLRWFLLANQMRHKLGLVEDTHLITSGLGHCWLSVPASRAAFATLCRESPWAGHRPDQLAYYLAAADETRALGDPRYHGKALINLLRFAREHRLAAEQRRASAELQRVYAAQPGLAELFAEEGWPTGL